MLSVTPARSWALRLRGGSAEAEVLAIIRAMKKSIQAPNKCKVDNGCLLTLTFGQLTRNFRTISRSLLKMALFGHPERLLLGFCTDKGCAYTCLIPRQARDDFFSKL